jgi:hypothetical protein
MWGRSAELAVRRLTGNPPIRDGEFGGMAG